MTQNNGIRIGFALCGSFCTFGRVIGVMKDLAQKGYSILPIMSTAASTTDTRFGKAEDFISEIRDICGTEPVLTIDRAEPIGPKKLIDVLVVEPATGNTLAKNALGITDSAVTMAIKAHLRNNKPVVFGVATNDALGASAKNIGLLHNTKNIF